MQKFSIFLTTTLAIVLGFSLQAKAEWHYIGDGEQGDIYMNDESVYIKDDLRSAEIKYKGFEGRALFVISCNSYSYQLESNVGNDEGYAKPGTVAGVVADEVCDNYYPE